MSTYDEFCVNIASMAGELGALDTQWTMHEHNTWSHRFGGKCREASMDNKEGQLDL